MKKIVFVVCVLLADAGVFAASAAPVKSLAGLKQVKIVVDVNVGNPHLLLLRMDLLDKTYRQLTAAGMKRVLWWLFAAEPVSL